MEASAWRKTALLVGVVVATLWTILACWRDVRGSTGGLLGRSASGSKLGISATVTPASSVRCNRIKLPARLHNATTGPYNPAAARHPVTGEWLMLHTLDEVSFTLSDMVRNGTNLGQLLNTHALLVRLGRWSSPSFRHSPYDDAALVGYDDSYLAAAQEAGATYFKCGDWRPFVWRDGVYLAHWIYYGRGEERMAISALDEPAALVRLVHVLSPLPREVAALRRAAGQAAAADAESLSAVAGSTWEREKNWGLVEDRGQLLAFHTLLPCTVALTFGQASDATDVGASARVASRACYTDLAAAALEATGLDILRDPIHGSGNPMPWDTEHGAGHHELLAMLHVKRGDYAHWAVRIDRATRRVTHLTAGPVLKARDYRNEGFLDSALVVGSFHVKDRVGEQGLERVVRILYGEGDRFGCWLDVAVEAIVWHELGAPDASAALPPSRGQPPSLPSGRGVAAAADAAAGGTADAAKFETLAWGSDLWLERGVRLRPGTSGAGGNDSLKEPPGGVRAVAHSRLAAAHRRSRDLGRLGRVGLAWSG